MFKMKLAYLTIDDAPSKDFKKKVNFLYKKKVPAIFFVIGKEAEKHKGDLIYAIKKGFIVGNHGYSHSTFSNLSMGEAKIEIERTEKIIEEIYKKANVKKQFKLFRFPFGDKGRFFLIFPSPKSIKLQRYLKIKGYSLLNFQNITYFYYWLLGLKKDADAFWTFDVAEWRTFYPKDKIKSLEWVQNKINHSSKINSQKSNEIILMHDHVQTTKYFEKIINQLLNKKIKFIGVK